MKRNLNIWQTADSEGINLDGYLEPETLWEFWRDAQGLRPIALARVLFPSKPSGYVTATSGLGNYAANKATAMECRFRGDIQAAFVYETICESIYSGLPEYARW